ncbi:MAG: periplasmic heavy metal sensor [Polyangia bacterium]
MRPQVKSTILWSLLGLSLALNAALGIGHLRSAAARTAGDPQARDDYCLLDQLELDGDQQRRLAEMRRVMHAKRAAYLKRAAAIKVELAEAISATEVDRAALDTQLDRYAEGQAEMQRTVVEHLLGVSAMLRPEQRDAFRTLLRTEMFRGIRSARGRTAGEP